MVEDVAAEIDRRLLAECEANSHNSFGSLELREWAIEYLEEYDDEICSFPELQGRPHWNLWMMDAVRRNALFAVLVFFQDSLDFFCGMGNSDVIRKFADNATCDATELHAELCRELNLSVTSSRFSRPSVEDWLGRSW